MKAVFPSGLLHRCCMAVVSSCREMLGSVPQRAQPACVVMVSTQTAGSNPEEGADDVKSARPGHLGLHTRYNGRDSGSRSREAEPIPVNPVVVRIGGCNSPP